MQYNFYIIFMIVVIVLSLLAENKNTKNQKSNKINLLNRLKKIRVVNNKKVLGTIGHLNVKFKGHDIIIKALGKLRKTNDIEYEYQIVGDGDKTRLSNLAKKYGVLDRVKFIGQIPHNEIFNWLDNIDVYCQPSKTEGLPRAVIEAMSRGTPVIGSNIAGIPELLDKRSIFNIQNNPVDNFIKVLNTKDKDRMLKDAQRNFKKSKEYDYKILEKEEMSSSNYLKQTLIIYKNIQEYEVGYDCRKL